MCYNTITVAERNILNILIKGEICPQCKADEIGLVKISEGGTNYKVKLICKVCGFEK